MKKRILAASAAVTVVFLAPSTAKAADFGKAGEISIGSDLNLAATGSLMTLAGGLGGGGAGLLIPASMLDVGGTSYSNNGGSEFGFSLAPAVDYFVIDGLSLGLEFLFGYDTYSPPSPPPGVTQPQSTNVTVYGIAPRVGYDLPITSTLSFWPKVFFEHAGYSLGGGGAGYGNIQLLGAYAPILYHPASHFYIGFGPNILTELGESSDGVSANSKLTSYGAFASVGGWFKMGE
jgi:hypothetical protein